MTTTIYQFNCSANTDAIAFSTDKSGANIPAGNTCSGEWVLYVDNIINDSLEHMKESNAEMFEAIQSKGWYITTEASLLETKENK